MHMLPTGGRDWSSIQPGRYRRQVRSSRPAVGVESPESSTEDHADDFAQQLQNPTINSHEGSPNPFFDDDALKCPICFDVFTIPKMLLCCGRSICQNCEHNVLSARDPYSRSSNCPVCASPRGLTGTALPVNVSLKNAMELFKSNPLQGETTLCEECEKPVKVDEVYCCATCDIKKKICSHCGLKKHKGHDIEEIGYVSKEDRESMVKEVEIMTKPYLTHAAVTTVCTNVRASFERCIRAADANLLKAKSICTDILGNNYMTEEMIKAKLVEAKKMNDLVAKDYEEIDKAKDDLHDLQVKLCQDILTRI